MSLTNLLFYAIDKIFEPCHNRKDILEQTKDVTVVKNIVYDQTDEKTCKLDIHYVQRETREKYPVIFKIHGGGFVAGDKRLRHCQCNWYAKNVGAFVVNVNYGLCPKYHFPYSMRHLVSAVNWVYDNAEKYNLDLTRFVADGDSAGGYYSAMLCVTQDNSQLQEVFGGLKARFSGVHLNCGVYDMMLALKTKKYLNVSRAIYKDFTGEKRSKMSKYKYLNLVSPITFVTETFPPCFLTYVERDIFCPEQGQVLANKLLELKTPLQIFYAKKGEGYHTFPLTWQSKSAKEHNEALKNWLLEHFEQAQ